MVNTFLVAKPDASSTPFRSSAKYLDNKRCFKQILEARQILTILLDLHAIVKIFKWDKFLTYEKDEIARFKENGEKVKNIRNRYLKSDQRLIFQNGEYKITDCSSLEGRIVKLGFSQHAVVRMWVGYENSLRQYINDHIDEWRSRYRKDGTHCKTSISKYDIKEEVYHPWWTNCFGFLRSHRAALLAKEIARNENPWYVDFNLFRISSFYRKRGYIWTNNLSLEDTIDLSNGKVKSKYFSPINEKAVKGKRQMPPLQLFTCISS